MTSEANMCSSTATEQSSRVNQSMPSKKRTTIERRSIDGSCTSSDCSGSAGFRRHSGDGNGDCEALAQVKVEQGQDEACRGTELLSTCDTTPVVCSSNRNGSPLPRKPVQTVRQDVLPTLEQAAVPSRRGCVKGCHRCDHCGKEFSQIGRLNQHLQVSHTGWKSQVPDTTPQTNVCCSTISEQTVVTQSMQSKRRKNNGQAVGDCVSSSGPRPNDDRTEDVPSTLLTENRGSPDTPPPCEPVPVGSSRKRQQQKNGDTPPQQRDKKAKRDYGGSSSASLLLAVSGDGAKCDTLLPEAVAGPGDRKLHECKHCGLKYKQKCHLSRHMKLHTEEQRRRHGEQLPLHKCSLCEREFERKDCLKKHLRIHAGLRPYPCDICGKTFPEASALKRHVTIHGDRKPYECGQCGRSYSQADYLKRHLLTHGGQMQPYACDVCGLRFTLPSRMRSHALTHTGVKPYPCDVCGRRYSRAEYVKQHKRLLHADHAEEPAMAEDEDEGQEKAAGLTPDVSPDDLREWPQHAAD